MLWNASAITGYAIAASDGQIGTVSDLLFDDTNWSVRWLVVDTGHWLSGRKVLLPPSVVGQVDPNQKEFSVKLTMQQVKDSPPYDPSIAIDRAYDEKFLTYYGIKFAAA
jgi:PRC-barrel domain